MRRPGLHPGQAARGDRPIGRNPLILLVNASGRGMLPTWQAEFGRIAPQLDVRWLDDPDVADAPYVFTWRPTPGRLASLPGLRLILSSGAGVDSITADPAWPRHVPIVRMGGDETVQRMGEYVCLAALSLLRDMPRIIAAQHARRWDSFDPDRCATDTRVGVMGLGNLGARAAEMLTGLGFQVAGWSRSPNSIAGVECFTELGAFLARTDILVCLLPDTPDTRGILDAALFARLPRGAKIVNAARGAHAVIDDVLAALDSGQLDSAMLDVFVPEPLPADHPAWRHPRVIVTPHTASLASAASRARYVADAIGRFERGETLPNLYDPERGY